MESSALRVRVPEIPLRNHNVSPAVDWPSAAD
jgi:hypothetical protein